eukprot:2821441-Prymnesium_polylepis.1
MVTLACESGPTSFRSRARRPFEHAWYVCVCAVFAYPCASRPQCMGHVQWAMRTIGCDWLWRLALGLGLRWKGRSVLCCVGGYEMTDVCEAHVQL